MLLMLSKRRARQRTPFAFPRLFDVASARGWLGFAAPLTLPVGDHTMTLELQLTLGDRVRRSGGTLSAEIDGETVALDVARGACYGLDAVAAEIWRLIESPVAVESVCDTLTALYEVEAAVCQRDVLDLLEDLRAAELITVENVPPRRDD